MPMMKLIIVICAWFVFIFLKRMDYQKLNLNIVDNHTRDNNSNLTRIQIGCYISITEKKKKEKIQTSIL